MLFNQYTDGARSHQQGNISTQKLTEIQNIKIIVINNSRKPERPNPRDPETQY